MGVRKSQFQRIDELKTKYPALDFSNSVYNGVANLMTAICPKHGEITKKGTHWNVNGCPQCGRDKAKLPNPERMKGWLRVAKSRLQHGLDKWDAFTSQNSDRFDFSESVYKGLRSKVKVRCLTHDYAYDALPASLMKQGSGCKFCGLDKLKLKSHSEAKNMEKLKLVHGDRYQYQSIPRLTHDKAIIICEKHGEFMQSLRNHLQGTGCPKCANVVSRGEQELYEYVKSLAIDAENRNRSVISPKEIDIFVPSRNLGIEYHGLHWHADDSENTPLKTKWQLCQDKGIRLVQIFEDEWSNRKHVVQDLIQAMLGLRRVRNARDLTVRIVERHTTKEFLDKWHIAGYANSSTHFGAFDGDELVAVLTTNKPRFDHQDIEIVRFAASCHIRGGFKKIFKVVVDALKPESVISYADLRFGTGNTYLDAGFTDCGITPSDYWWFKKQERLPRYRTQKHKLKSDPRFSEFYSDDKTENQICVAAGYRKISGVGHRKMVWYAKE